MLSSSNQNQSSRFRYYKRSCRATSHCLYFCLPRIKETIIVPFPQDSSVLTSDPLAMRAQLPCARSGTRTRPWHFQQDQTLFFSPITSTRTALIWNLSSLKYVCRLRHTKEIWPFFPKNNSKLAGHKIFACSCNLFLGFLVSVLKHFFGSLFLNWEAGCDDL